MTRSSRKMQKERWVSWHSVVLANSSTIDDPTPGPRSVYAKGKYLCWDQPNDLCEDLSRADAAEPAVRRREELGKCV